MNKSLDEILGERVFKAIKQTGRYSLDSIENISKKFTRGSLTEEDWRLFVEIELEKKEKDDQKD